MGRKRRNRYEERNASKVGEEQSDMNYKVREDKEKLFPTRERVRERPRVNTVRVSE